MAELAQLRKEAKRLKIEDWEELTIAELEAAVVEARGGEPMAKKAKPKAKPRSAAKAAPRKKRAAASSNGTGPNPYREGTQRWYYAEALLKGGKLTEIVRRVRSKVEIKPAPHNDTEEYREASIRGRAVVIARDLAARGFNVEIEGRGKESVFSVTPPK